MGKMATVGRSVSGNLFKDDLNIIKSLVRQISNMEKIEPKNKTILTVLLIRQYLNLCENIQRNLDYAVKRVEPNEEIDYKQELKKWEEHESYEHINSLLDEIVAMRDEIGFQIMSSMFEYLSVVSEKKYVILSQLRELLISKLATKCETFSCCKELFTKFHTQTKLLNVAMLFSCLNDNKDLIQQLIEIIFDGYAEFLTTEKYIWNGNIAYESDEGKLPWYLAGIFSQSSDPYLKLISLVDTVLIKGGGGNIVMKNI
jgi:hypothetical protein